MYANYLKQKQKVSCIHGCFVLNVQLCFDLIQVYLKSQIHNLTSRSTLTQSHGHGLMSHGFSLSQV